MYYCNDDDGEDADADDDYNKTKQYIVFIMRLSQFCENKLQAQYSFTYQTQYIAKKYIHNKK